MIAQHIQLFKSLNSHAVEYLLIGGTLAIAYGVPRVTKDIDIFLRPTIRNAEQCLAAMTECGLGTAQLTTAQALSETEVTIFKDAVRLDVLTQVKGLTFDHAWQHKVFIALGDVHIPALQLDDLIAAKHAAGRPGDLEDIRILELARQHLKPSPR